MKFFLKSLNKTNLIVLIAIVLFVLGIGYWISTLFYWAEEEIDHGFSKAAMQNDFLAAKRFLQKQGVAVSVVKNLTLIDKGSWRNIPLKPDDTIVMINGYKTIDYDRYTKISEWIESGGTFIMSPQNPFVGSHTDQNDQMLDELGIEKLPEKFEEKADFFDQLSKDLKKKEKDIEEKKKQRLDNEKVKEETDKRDSVEKTKSSIKTEEQRQIENKEKQKIEEKKEQKEKYSRRCGKKKEAAAVGFKGQTKPLMFDFSREEPFIYYDYDHLDNEGDPEERSEHLLYFPWSEGSVTILSDTTIWTNKRIDCQDHAFALWSLVNLDGRVWFLINQDAPSLWVLVWRNAPYGLLACVFALIFWLWAKSQTLGPVFKQSILARRSLTEHLYATGMLLWRKFQSPQLLTTLRKDILTVLEQRHLIVNINENDTSGKERLKFIQDLTGLSQDAIQYALFADGINEPQDLSRVIAHLQLIRKKI